MSSAACVPEIVGLENGTALPVVRILPSTDWAASEVQATYGYTRLQLTDKESVPADV